MTDSRMMNPSSEDPSTAEVAFVVTKDAATTGVQVGGAVVAGLASGLAKGLWWLAGKASRAVADSHLYRGAVTTAAQRWSSATKSIVKRRTQLHRQHGPEDDAAHLD